MLVDDRGTQRAVLELVCEALGVPFDTDAIVDLASAGSDAEPEVVAARLRRGESARRTATWRGEERRGARTSITKRQIVDECVIGGQIGPEIWRLVQNWTPAEVHDHERKYQSELQEYLDEQLNGGGEPMNVGMGGGRSHAVSTERGTAYGDVVVDDTVGIELKRNFSNSQKRKLRGQLEDYGDSYEFVIACACGIEDTDGWREVKNKLSGQRGMMDMTEFRFTIKRRENFGDGGGQSGGVLGGDGLL